MFETAALRDFSFLLGGIGETVAHLETLIVHLGDEAEAAFSWFLFAVYMNRDRGEQAEKWCRWCLYIQVLTLWLSVALSVVIPEGITSTESATDKRRVNPLVHAATISVYVYGKAGQHAQVG